MRLSPGSSVGPYRILSSLGAGGMGEVYRAEHVRLGREVAVKVLHELTSDNPEYKSRFEREARVLASLNHPNIATLHGLEEVGESTLLEMELVPGETLAERISRGPIAPSDTLPIFKQIAQALEAAHERGIIHRDLKPSNIKVTPEGRVKVLDFGLAKAFETEKPEGSSNAALFTTTTQRGLILGTAAYMSPEHVRGKTLDRRTDIWAFGCMFFEAISGKPPFASETVSDTLAAVLREEPDWRQMSQAPMAVQRLIRRCLRKDPQTRLHDIADASLEIDDAVVESTPLVVPVPGHDPVRISRKRALIAIVAGAAVLAAAAAIALWIGNRPRLASEGAIARLGVPIPGTQQVERGGLAPLTISPDGAFLVYAATETGHRTQLYMRPLDKFESTTVAGTEGASAPFVSPDGRWIGFYANGMLQRVSIDGGAAIRIAETPAVWSASWGAGDTIVYAAAASPGGLWRVPAGGGTPEKLTTVDTANGEIQHGYPRLLPNGDVLYSVVTDRGWHFAALTPGTKQVRALGQPGTGGAGAQYVESGHLLYASGGGFVAVPFDPARGVTTGSPIPLLERPEVDPSGGAAFAVSASGTLAYLPRPTALPLRSLVTVNRDGHATLISDARGAFSHPRLSRDGRRLAVALESDTGSDIWVYDLDRRSRTRLTNGGVNGYPIWSHDNQRVTYQSVRSTGVSLYSRRADASGEAEALIRSGTDQSGLSRSLAGLLPGTMPVLTASNPHVPMSWSPDGANLAFDERKPSAERDIWILPTGGDPFPFLVTPFDESSPAFSPTDGKWLAYVSDESGRSEVYVQPFPGPGAKWLISIDGGTEPAWSPDGKELFFRRGDALMSAAVTTTGDFKSERPKVVFDGRYATVDGARNYDVVPDKPGFVVVRSDGSGEGAQFNVVLNWFSELRGRR